jgi:cell division transport system permease protein
MASLSYHFGEAATNLRRDRGSKVFAVATIALAVFVLGAFLLVTRSLDRLMSTWSAVAEMSVYLRDDASDEQRAAVETAISGSPLVERRAFVSKDEAARRFRRDFPDLASAAGGLGDNPFPASFEVRLHPQRAAPADLRRLGQSLGQMAGVADVRYDQEWLERLTRLVGVLRWTGMTLAAILALAAGLTVAAVVRLGMFARRDEVEIMSLVGAPLAAIRGPFVVEGILQGGAGSVAALAALAAAYAVVRARLASAVPGMDMSLLQFLPWWLLATIVAAGMAVGCVGGYVATRGVK